MAKRPVRSAQVISPFGVGAMVDFAGPESLMHAGLDAWTASIEEAYASRIPEELRITNEPDLARELDVGFFVLPPVFERAAAGRAAKGSTVPFVRFPLTHQCVRCGRLHTGKLHAGAPPRCECSRDRRGQPDSRTVQVRFVAACREGHVRDFPWLEWLAGSEEGRVGALRAEMADGAYLRLRRTGRSGGAGLTVELVRAGAGDTKTVAWRSMSGAFGGDPMGTSTPLSTVGIRCTSENPATGITTGHRLCRECDAPLVTVLRGAGNLHYAETESAIHVPATVPGELTGAMLDLFDDEGLVGRLLHEVSRSRDGRLSEKDARRVLRAYPKAPEPDPAELATFVGAFNEREPFRTITGHHGLSEKIRQVHFLGDPIGEILPELLHELLEDGEPGDWTEVPPGLGERLRRWADGEEREEGEAPDESVREREYRVFGLLRHEAVARPKSILSLRGVPATDYRSDLLRQGFEHVGLLDTLRETRALKGFSRLVSLPDRDHTSLLWRHPPGSRARRWLPASIVFGEGIFLRLGLKRLCSWEEEFGDYHGTRLRNVARGSSAVAESRGQEAPQVNPRELLVHTLAHLLINQLVLECGYGSASLRERLYVSQRGGRGPEDRGMAGLLVYTAAGDSEGTLGGLVRMGESGSLESTMARALSNALWCSSDPVCMESLGQGPLSCNLAACHSCALLPETSCERQNRLLDRGVVVGTLQNPESGFFSCFVR